VYRKRHGRFGSYRGVCDGKPAHSRSATSIVKGEPRFAGAVSSRVFQQSARPR